MGAAGSVGEPAAAAAEEPAAAEDLTEEQKAAKAAEEEAKKAALAKENLRRAKTYDACAAPFEERLASEPTKQEKIKKPSTSLFAAPEAPPASEKPAAEEKPAEEPAKPRSSPYYTQLGPEEKSILLQEMCEAGTKADAVTEAEAVGDAVALAYKVDVYKLIADSAALTDDGERAKKMDTIREIMLSAIVAATRLAAAMRGRQERIELAKKGKKTKKPGKKKGKKK